MSDLKVAEEFPSYDGLLSQGSDQLLKHAFDHVQNLSGDAGKYFAMLEITFSLISLAAAKDRKR
jgi:hypothetical protein